MVINYLIMLMIILTWLISYSNSTGAGTFAIINTKLYVPVENLSTQDNAKLLQQLKSGFKGTIKWNKCHSKVKLYDTKNPYLDFLIDPRFQGVNRLFVLSFENDPDITTHTGYYLPKF